MSTLTGRAVAQDVEADTVTSEAEPRVLWNLEHRSREETLVVEFAHILCPTDLI